jgi:hypothetical protein
MIKKMPIFPGFSYAINEICVENGGFSIMDGWEQKLLKKNKGGLSSYKKL